jgi:hypothetical protein
MLQTPPQKSSPKHPKPINHVWSSVTAPQIQKEQANKNRHKEREQKRKTNQNDHCVKEN